MIQLTRIAPEDPIKRLRTQINHAMNEIEGDQPMVGLGSNVEADYWGPGENASGFRHVAHSALNEVHGTLLLQCLPDTQHAVITGVDGEVWPSVKPELDIGLTKLTFTWVTLSIKRVSLPGRALNSFKTLVEYGLPRQNYDFAPHLTEITREPVFPLGLKAIFKITSTDDLTWSAAYLSGTIDKCMVILHTVPLSYPE